MRQIVSATLIGLAVSLSATALPADEPDGLAVAAALQEVFVKAIESAEKSVVSIARDKVQSTAPTVLDQNRDLFPRREARPSGFDDPDYIPNEFGAGIIIDENGLILTNYHLVRGGPLVEARPDFKPEQALYVRLADRRGFEAKIFAADPRSDLAVLKIPAAGLKPLPIGNASQVRKGQFVIALGNPYLIARDGSASATWGIVSNLVRQALQNTDPNDLESRRRETIQNLGVLMQVDTRLDLGTSGGALLNLRGELIGVTTTLASIVGYEKSAGFAVPIDDSTRRIIEALRQGKEVEYGFLGIRPENVLASEFTGMLAPVAERFHQYGAARIATVVQNLPAHRAGIEARDVVLRVGAKPVFSTKDLMREIGLAAPGTVVNLQVWRPQTGQELNVPVEIGKWPVIDEEGMVYSVRLRDPWRGMIYDYPTARKRTFDDGGHTSRFSGVMIQEVLQNSPTDAAQLRPIDVVTHVKGRPVRSPREFQELVQGETGAVSLTILPASAPLSGSRTVEVKPR